MHLCVLPAGVQFLSYLRKAEEQQQDVQTPPGPLPSTEVKAAYPASLLVPLSPSAAALC